MAPSDDGDLLATAPPAVARLGFDRGWHFLAPTFLNFKMPTVLIDHRLIDDADLNLEPFADHHPDTPWRTANALLRLSSETISLWQRQPEQLITTIFRPSGANRLDDSNQLILIIGDTYDVQLTWSALWTCHIGACNREIRKSLRSSSRICDDGPQEEAGRPTSSSA